MLAVHGVAVEEERHLLAERFTATRLPRFGVAHAQDTGGLYADGSPLTKPFRSA